MANERSIRRYRRWYSRLLRLYPKPHRERFGESMQQTFHDLCRERAEAGRGLFGLVLWMFVETSAGIVRENSAMMMQSTTRRLMVWAVVVALILLIPLVGMQFSEDVNWTLFDFAFMGALLFGAGAAFELVSTQRHGGPYRLAVGAAVAAAVLLVWVNGSVGIIGDGPVNWLYFGVLGVGLAGALIARFKPRGMSLALFAMALAQMLVPVIALVIAKAEVIRQPPGVVAIFALNAGFALLFAGSGWLFQRAAPKHA